MPPTPSEVHILCEMYAERVFVLKASPAPRISYVAWAARAGRRVSWAAGRLSKWASRSSRYLRQIPSITVRRPRRFPGARFSDYGPQIPES